MSIILSYLAACFMRPQDGSEWLNAWFAKDSRGESCVSCHSPDGIELVGFSDSDIRRRILRHHSSPIGEKVRSLILSHGKSSGDALELRPMQPGGKVLSGSTVEERDNLFLANLAKTYPKLLEPIHNLTEAEDFQQKVLAIDLTNLPVGIELNRLSEDGAHGPEHASIANWFPDVATFDPATLRDPMAEYLKSPTDEALLALDRQVVALAKTNDALAVLSLAKYRCLLVFQHELRTGKHMTMLSDGNPFWQVAEFGRVYAESDIQTIKAPSVIVEAKNMSKTLAKQMKQLRVPWFWLGWIRDPSLTKSGLRGETVRADYFCKYLEEDGPYIGHEALMLTRKLAEQDRNPLSPNHPRHIQYSFFLANTPLLEREPKDKDAKRIFRAFTANSFRMSLLLLEKDLGMKKKAFQPIPQLSQIRFIEQYLADIKVPETNMIQRVVKTLKQVGKIQ